MARVLEFKVYSEENHLGRSCRYFSHFNIWTNWCWSKFLFALNTFPQSWHGSPIWFELSWTSGIWLADAIFWTPDWTAAATETGDWPEPPIGWFEAMDCADWATDGWAGSGWCGKVGRIWLTPPGGRGIGREDGGCGTRLWDKWFGIEVDGIVLCTVPWWCGCSTCCKLALWRELWREWWSRWVSGLNFAPREFWRLFWIWFWRECWSPFWRRFSRLWERPFIMSSNCILEKISWKCYVITLLRNCYIT